MELKSKNNQEIIRAQMLSLIISFVFFNAILVEIDWLILSSIILLVLISIVLKIFGGRLAIGIDETTNNSRRVK